MKSYDPTTFPEENPDPFDSNDWGNSGDEDSPDSTQIDDDINYLPPPPKK